MINISQPGSSGGGGGGDGGNGGEWLGVSSAHLDSHCGDTSVYTLANALDGTNVWYHEVNEVHWFILDLGQTYDVQKVRGRSLTDYDPIDVNIYVSNDKEIWGAAVATGIDAFQDSDEWQEADVTDKEGRYVKVEIIDCEDTPGFISYGGIPSFSIFDVYGVAV